MFSLHARAFVNLDFESADLTPIPPGQFGGSAPIGFALPGWTGYLGTNRVSSVLQNNLTLGTASLDILGPNWNNVGGIRIIDGQYTVILQPGFDPFGSGHDVSASISQTGLVPANAESIRFKALASGFSVSIAGQRLSLVTLGMGASYTLYGADVSSFAGQAAALTITGLAQPNGGGFFDSIVFSPSPVPEPSIVALLLCAGVAFFLARPLLGPQR